MTRTPWGDADDLGRLKLPPGPATPRGDVEVSQRRRLLAAVVAVVDRDGYEAMTVRDVIELAGVSRGDFYRQFENREECFLAAVDAISELSSAGIAEAYARGGGWEARLRAAFDAAIEQAVRQPAAARALVVAIHAAGPGALRRDEWALERHVRLARAALADSPERATMPVPIVRGIVGGLTRVVHSRLRRREETELPALADELFEWAVSYTAPPGKLVQPRPRNLPQPTYGVGSDPAERMLAAFAATVAEHGYPQTTVSQVAARGSASIGTFYAHFDDKPDALVAALDLIGARTIAAAGPASRREEGWPAAIRAALRAMLLHFAEHPAWARLAIVEALAADSAALDRLDQGVEDFRALLLAGAHDPPPSPLVTEAISGAILSLCHSQIRKRGPEHLPELLPLVTYIALAPFTGPKHALALANESTSPSRRRRERR